MVTTLSELREIDGNQRLRCSLKVLLDLIYHSFLCNNISEERVISCLFYINSYDLLPKTEMIVINIMLDE